MKTEPESKRAIETARTAIAQVDRRKLEKREHREMYDRASQALEMLEDLERKNAATAGERADRIIEGFMSSARAEDGRGQLSGFAFIGPGFLLIGAGLIGAGLATWWHWVVGLFFLFPAAVLVVLFVRKRWLKKRVPADRPAIVAQGTPDRSPTIPKYEQDVFQCYGDYQRCKNHAESPICAALFVACVAQRIVPLAGGGGP